MKCPICNGEGGWSESIASYYNEWWDCGACKETGKVSLLWMIKYWFWNIVPVWFIEWQYDMCHKEDK